MNLAFVLALVSAFADWYAVARQNKALEYVFKPATLFVLIVATVLLLSAPHDAWQAQWFLLGLSFSLLGDIFLVLPNPRWFLFGLAAFLLAHLSYIVGLNPTLPPSSALAFLLPCALVVGLIVWHIVSALRASHHASLVVPVTGYGVAMTLMVFSAFTTFLRPDWSNSRRALVICGATLFFISDAMLAWNRFVKPFSAAKLAIIITYHLGQIALALSIAN